MSKGGYVSFMAVYSGTSPRLTAEGLGVMFELVDEIISTVTSDTNHTVSFIHTMKRVRKDAMSAALHNANITGFETLIFTVHQDNVVIENHPLFQLLIQHEFTANPSFTAWYCNKERKPLHCSGFELLKSKLFRGLPDINQGIYVLRMDNRPKPFFYVGKAKNIKQRITQHADGEGAYCITGEPFTRVDPISQGILFELFSAIQI